jgi:cell division transport system permease protein
MKAWFAQHASAFSGALQRLVGSPLNTILSLLVIGIALTLPAAGYVLLDNLQGLARNASGTQQISVFLKLAAGGHEREEVERHLNELHLAGWQFIPREQALQRLKNAEGLEDIVASLPRNPLPDAYVLQPGDASPARLEEIAKTIAAWPQVEHVQLDSAWIHRLDAFLRLGRLAVTLLGAIFGAGLIAVTFNTIRLQVLAQADEIEVARLIGATDAFIRRPFYYFGALQGMLGGLLAAGLVALGIHQIAAPVAELAGLYGGEFTLHGPDVRQALLLGLSGGVLGWLGAQLSVSLSLYQLD